MNFSAWFRKNYKSYKTARAQERAAEDLIAKRAKATYYKEKEKAAKLDAKKRARRSYKGEAKRNGASGVLGFFASMGQNMQAPVYDSPTPRKPKKKKRQSRAKSKTESTVYGFGDYNF